MSTHRLPPTSVPDEGELVQLSVDGRVLAVARSAGRLYAFDDECTHQQCSLADGDVDGGTVICPCHLGTFDMANGAVLSGPPKSALRTYPARLTDDALELDVE